MAKNEDLEQLQTSRRLLSKQQDELNGDLGNQSTSIEIDFTSPKQMKQLSALELEQSTGWLFGIYIRYLIWPQCSLLIALYVSVAFDIMSLVYQSLLVVPLIFDGGKQVFSASLTLCLIQMVLQVVSVKLTMQMILFRHFKLISTLLHILRLLVFAVIGLQIIFHRQIKNDSVPLNIINKVYPAIWSLQVMYQPLAIWVGISVRYWITVLGTKQRILLLLHNKVPANVQGR